ncbi:MAG: OmpA family protein [Phaeodactylibacter sp.]|nr:OmpA family protein [Phaeodactylibacter sp.]MCB9267453.1 OmpA family protein [Lewinellaceae bacterium]MCB9288756.1 OmpA family protein [Lewinellaceae bacterium]
MKHNILILFVALAAFSSCVTQKEYQELEEQKKYYETEALLADSLRNEYNKLAEESRQLEIELRNTRLDLEQYVVTNKSLQNSYMALLDRVEELKNDRNELDITASYEKYNLERQLSDQQLNLDDVRKRQEGLEYELYQKDNRLNAMEYDYSNVKGALQERNIRIQELEQMLNTKEANMTDVRSRLDGMLSRFSSSDLSVEERNGKLYLSLSSNLLFPSGSTRIDAEGKRALKELAGALKNNPDIDILVEGHTDSDGSALTNWNLSVDRAVAVTDLLVANGVNPERITAAGRGEYLPKAPNNTAFNKSLNRRTEIIISPKLDELYQYLEGQ